MPIRGLDTFNKTFWKYYDTVNPNCDYGTSGYLNDNSQMQTKTVTQPEKKQFSHIINDIPKLLKFKYDPCNESVFQKLLVFSLIALAEHSTKASNDYVEAICKKYDCVIESAYYPVTAVKYFICLEYLLRLTDIPKEALRHSIESLAPAVLNKVTSRKHSWTNEDMKLLNRFIIVLVELESRLSSRYQCTPTFETTIGAVTFFSTLTTDERNTAYPKYLLAALTVLMSYHDRNVDSVDGLMQIRSISKTKCGKDIAIMVSQILRAGTLLISKGSTLYKQKIVTVLNDLYEIIRNKNLSAFEYTYYRNYDQCCCKKPITHAGLQIMETVRSIVVEAVKVDSFNEILISVMSNFAICEAEMISNFDCSKRANLKRNLRETFRFVRENIQKIVTTCGLERGKRTLLKFLAIQSLEPSECVQIINALLNFFKTANRDEKISWLAMKLMFSTNEKSRIHSMFEIHQIQDDNSKQLETISAIVNGLPKRDYPVKLDAVQLQLLQLKTEIEYPRLSAFGLEKLIKDMSAMDLEQTDGFSASLCKSSLLYLQFLNYYKEYNSNVRYDKQFQPLNGKFVSLKKEVDNVSKLKKALDYLANLIPDKAAWEGDNTIHIPLAERLLQRIGETLMNRHYKDLAIIAFDLLYKFATIIDRPHNQITAAGHLVENIYLARMVSEKEIVTELHTLIMQKLRHVDAMNEEEQGSFMLGFLQLTMYTMRRQYNIEHAKKYIQAINKLLNKHDSEKKKFLGARLKYAEVMFELIVRNPDTTITPVTFIEDIFHRFKRIQILSWSDYLTVPGIVLDLLITLHDFTHPRYELRYASPLNFTLHFAAIRKGYLFLFAKATILETSENLLTNGKNLESRIQQLDVLFDYPSTEVPGSAVSESAVSGSAVPDAAAEGPTKTKSETTTWNEDLSPLIHPNCKCSQCSSKFLNTLTMDVATLKASAAYFKKDYAKSLASFKRIYSHWTAFNTFSYSGMLMHYSNCLISNNRREQSNAILNEALDVCNDYAQAQDITVRLLMNTKSSELDIVEEVKPYADEVRPKAGRAARTGAQPKKKGNSKAADSEAAKVYPKRSNLRY